MRPAGSPKRAREVFAFAQRLARARATLLASVTLWTAVSLGNPEVASSPKPTREERVNAARADALRARELATKGVFAVEYLSRAAFAARVDDAPAAGAPASGDAASGDASGPDDEAVRKLLLSLREPRPTTQDDVAGRGGLAAQGSGLYAPSRKTLFVVDDGPGAADGTVLVHEFVHALQDEHFDLAAMLREDALGADALNARHALAEGDATFAVLRDANLLEPIDEAFLSAFTKGFAAANRKNAGDRTRVIEADALSAPYVYGTQFVWALYANGGWPAVNAAWKRPPTTTEQLLHMRKYRARERPVPLRGVTLEPAGYARRAREPFGELDVRAWLGAFVSEDESADLAAGWGNGFVELYADDVRPSHGRALRVRLRWDDALGGQAVRTRARLDRAFTERFGAPATRAGVTCFERPHVGPIALAASLHELAVYAGPTRFDARDPDAVVGQSTCDEVFRWAARARPAR